jgi:hypothetical protein
VFQAWNNPTGSATTPYIINIPYNLQTIDFAFSLFHPGTKMEQK